MSKTIGVVIARFQTPWLTIAHRHLLTTAAAHGRLLVLLGHAPVYGTRRQPLEYGLRADMVEEWYHATDLTKRMTILPLPDHPSNKAWATSVDAAIASIHPYGDAIIYGGADGAGSTYTLNGGRWPIKTVPSVDNIRATSVREAITPIYDGSFRAGVIYATQQRFVNPMPVVDVIVTRGPDVLLAHKLHDGPLHRLIGGFVDVTDQSLEAAAQREVAEETGIGVGEMTYLGSRPVADWRYRRGPEGILSMVFTAPYLHGFPKPQDDIDGLTWVPAKDALNQLVPQHRPLFSLLKVL